MTYFTEQQLDDEIDRLGLRDKTDRQLCNMEGRTDEDKHPLKYTAIIEEQTRRFENTYEYENRTNPMHESREEIERSNGYELEGY